LPTISIVSQLAARWSRIAIRSALIALFLFAACGRTTIDRSHWQQMSANEKTLYVRSLLGHEQAKESKGGTPLVHPQRAEAYVQAIDAAYAHGETRDADTLFDTMGAPRR
jgi:predicted Fe-S protein YdhL (DUF1289 family)